ncbi:MAG: T9SS type A sorting domain-containing protein [Bacteroidia bacterium]|nr:T9SS type A sorting domain-containing protein [Bacteroidia bacterium]
MIKHLFTLSIFIISMGVSAQSPITIGNANMPGNNDTLRYTNASPVSLGNYTQTGVNFTWDFSTLVSLSEGVRSFKNALQTPYAFYFLALNAFGEKIADTLGAGPVTITNFYNYYKKQTNPVNAFIADGVGMTFSSVPVPSYYSDKDELYKFPMTYPQYDSTTFKFSTLSNSLLPITYSKGGYRVTKVDGWGKVITPYDTVNCLRLITTQYAEDTIKTSIGPITIPFGFPNYQRSYQWMSLNSKIPFLEVSGSLVNNVFTITQVRYRGYERIAANPVSNGPELQETNIGLYPNPVKDKLQVFGLSQEPSNFEVYALDGKKVLSGAFKSMASEQSLDLSGLEKGVYFLNILGTSTKTSMRFVKE